MRGANPLYKRIYYSLYHFIFKNTCIRFGEEVTITKQSFSIQVSRVGTLSSSVQLGTGSFRWSLQISSLEINANWNMKYDLSRWLPTVRDSGRLSASMGQSGITLTVQPVVETGSVQVILRGCSASLSGLEVFFDGSILSQFYTLVANAFEGDIRRQLEIAANLRNGYQIHGRHSQDAYRRANNLQPACFQYGFHCGL
ncbi:hypothetical protein DPMN_188888 [Dreissena polymorpha]|uniref:Lipid-binding serum glycoprotein N-terminal domain-containing protein n=1 Tax=Dreissena polymorpha TaxID=45954 RepID=A0A9D4IAG7_DREPO|nr:hypothetical protein DPMN_188888 [Dreissena polymorpha]